MGRGPDAPGETQGFSSRRCTASAPAPSFQPGTLAMLTHLPRSLPPKGPGGRPALRLLTVAVPTPPPGPGLAPGQQVCEGTGTRGGYKGSSRLAEVQPLPTPGPQPPLCLGFCPPSPPCLQHCGHYVTASLTKIYLPLRG